MSHVLSDFIIIIFLGELYCMYIVSVFDGIFFNHVSFGALTFIISWPYRIIYRATPLCFYECELDFRVWF